MALSLTVLLAAACVLAPAAGQLIVLDPAKVRLQLSLGKSLLRDFGDGEPLMLSPYLEAGKAAKARMKARVKLPPFDGDDIVSYSGYFTVDKRFNANTFFWYFPAEEPAYGNDAPLLIWLQGGPGSSSMYGLFTELGPYRVSDNGSLEIIPHSWHRNYSVLFIDNPVGTGMSFTDVDGIPSNQTQVADNLYSALTQFYSMFAETRDRDLYLTGESYAGKYVPAFAYAIHQRNPSAEHKIRLKGLLMGNGFSDPISSSQFSDYVYQLGLVDARCRDHMKEMEQKLMESLRNGEHEDALMYRHLSMRGFFTCSEYSNVYNYLYPSTSVMDSSYVDFLRREDVRQALHVGGKQFQELSYEVYYSMIPDMMVSVKSWVEELLDAGYRVVYYSGQLDIIVAYPPSVRYYNSLQFAAAQEYQEATRRAWYVDGELAGYAKTGGNFTEVMVRNAGHMVPTDQPVWALDIVRRTTSGEGF